MKAAVLIGAKSFDYMYVDRPKLQPGEVLVRVKAVGICGTDKALYDGAMPFSKWAGPSIR